MENIKFRNEPWLFSRWRGGKLQREKDPRQPSSRRSVAMAETAETFGTLLARARRGDQAAMAELVQQYEPKVRLVARVRLGPALRPYLDSMDLVQSVHRSLMLGLRQDKFSISSPEQLLALALTLVRRKVARHWRHLQRQQRLSLGPDDGGNLANLLTSLTGPHDDPAQAAQLNDQVRHLCSNLEESERRMLDLRLQGYSTAEIAQDLGLHAIALRVRLTRLRQRLQASGVLTDWL
jgi:RNA polymerase sigma-70 factor (ECF subfamily)